VSASEIIFLTLDDVLLLHDLQLERYGGATGIRERPLLEFAIHMAQASFDGTYVHNNLYEMAAAYAFHIAENQPFVDGNKRTALAATLVFLDMNFIEIEDPEELLYSAMINIAQKTLNKSGLAQLLQKLTVVV